MTSEIHYTNNQSNCIHSPKSTYLLLNVIQTIRAVNCEADEDNVRVGIAQGPQSMKRMKVASEAISKGNSGSEFTDHSLLDLLYPKGQVRRAFRLLRRLLHSSRRRWERKPEMKSAKVNYTADVLPGK